LLQLKTIGNLLVPQTLTRDRFTWLAYLFLAFYGYFLNILGPITPFLKDELNLSYTISSLHFTGFAAGILLVGMFGHLVIQRIGRWRSLWASAFGISASTLLLIGGKSPFITIAAAFFMGLVGSLILVIVPSALSDRHGPHQAVALSEANVIASLAATGAPMMVGWFAHLPGGWRLALGIAALTPLLLRLFLGSTDHSVSEESRDRLISAKKPLPRSFWVYWTALVLAVSIEFCMVFWSADYLENQLGFTRVNAAQAVSIFLAAMIIGRLVGSRLVRHFSVRQVILASILLAGVGFWLFWTTGNAVLGLVGLFFTGLGVACLYPLTLSLAIGTARDNTVQASTRTTLASGTAILVLPLVLGRLADLVGIRQAYGIVGFLLAGALLIIILSKTSSAGCIKLLL
jgi:fucose permease